MSVIELKTKEEFDNFLKNNEKVFVDFYADWCGPCKMIAPKIQEFAAKYTNIKFAKVNVDVAKEVAKDCGITAMPTFYLYVNGNKIKDQRGANEAKVEEMLSCA